MLDTGFIIICLILNQTSNNLVSSHHFQINQTTDPRHDNKRYAGTTALANAKPLPNAVRVMEAHCADNPQDQAEMDDIVVISHVEQGEDKNGLPHKV